MRYLFLLVVLLMTSFKSICQSKPSVQIYAGTELLNVIQLLSGHANNIPSTYQQEILSFFEKYKNHPAVQKARNLPFINCDFPLRLSWAFYNFPRIKLHPLDTLVGYEQYFKKEQINDYFKECVNFYNDTHFIDFYNSHRLEYATWVSTLNRNLYQDHLLSTIDSFYRIVPSKIFFNLEP